MNLDILEEAINDLIGGSAVCFVGAGFSFGAVDSNNQPVPGVTELCHEICKLPGLQDEADAQLSDLAEFCEDHEDLKPKFRTLLLTRLTLCRPTDEHKRVMAMPWRAVFTTNFDDVAEVAAGSNKLRVITPVFDARNLRSDDKPLYYLHGRALDILSGAVDPKLVVSEKNYLELKARNRDLYAVLENEIHSASRVFFIGYSIRDAEIASRLFSIEGLREKSVVICSPKEKGVTLNRLRKFGEVFSIGVGGFAEKLPTNPNALVAANPLQYLRYVKQIKPEIAKADIDASDVDQLILAGKFSYSAYAAQQSNTFAKPEYCIPRSKSLSQIFSPQGLVNRFIVSSDLGNGKSIFLEQATHEAHSHGYEVFLVDTQLKEALAELDQLLASPSKKLFIIDGFIRYRLVAKHIGRRLPGNAILLIASGNYVDEIAHAELAQELNGAAREIDLNILSDEELAHWDHFLERWGFWESQIEETPSERFEFLKRRCGAENRSIVLAMFKNSGLSSKIDQIVRYFLTQNPEHSRSFIAVLINALCHRHVEWPRIVSWLDIDQQAFKTVVEKSPVYDFMVGSRKWYEFTSTQLADHIFGNYDFQEDAIVDVYTRIVRETAYSANDPRSGFDARENLKELMRFRFLTRLFSGRVDGGGAAINAVYHRLSNVPRIRTNDQFWL